MGESHAANSAMKEPDLIAIKIDFVYNFERDFAKHLDDPTRKLLED